MQTRYLRRLPESVRGLVGAIEERAACEVAVELSPRLCGCGGGSFEVLGEVAVVLGEGPALEAVRICVAREVTPELLTHELLHLKYMLLEGSPRLRYLDSALGAFHDRYGIGINIGDRVEHAVLYAEMEQIGFANGRWTPGGGIRGLIARSLMDLDSYTPGIPRRAAGLLTWLQVRKCFPTLTDHAAGALSRFGLLADAERLAHALDAYPDWNRDRPAVLACCAAEIGMPRDGIELRAFRNFGRWTVDRWNMDAD